MMEMLSQKMDRAEKVVGEWWMVSVIVVLWFERGRKEVEHWQPVLFIAFKHASVSRSKVTSLPLQQRYFKAILLETLSPTI